eukprot:452766_1
MANTLLVLVSLSGAVRGQVVPIPGAYDACDSLSDWTTDPCSSTIESSTTCDLQDDTWAGRTCIVIGPEDSQWCLDLGTGSKIQKDFDLTGYWNLSVEVEIMASMAYLGNTHANMFAICQGFETQIKSFWPRPLPRDKAIDGHLWDTPSYIFLLHDLTFCEDAILTLKFDASYGEYWNTGFMFDAIQFYGTLITASPTVSPTGIPTLNPSMNPFEAPTKAPNLDPTEAPTLSPTFPSNIACQQIFVSNTTGLDLNDVNNTFKVVDFVGINNRLHWELNHSGAVYELYYDQQWKIAVDDEECHHIRDTNDNLTTIDEAAGFPPLNTLSSWVCGTNTKSTTLRLSCAHANEGEQIDIDSPAEKLLEWTTFIVVGALLALAVLFTIIAVLFHLRKKGSDAPGYLSIIKFFIEIIDLYTDVSFTYSVYLSGNPLIWYAAPAAIILFAYLVSVITSLIKVNLHKRNMLYSNYMKSFDKAWLTTTLIVGYYATFNIFTSHLFHLEITSFQVPEKEKNNVKTLKIVNFVILENLPMFILQAMYLLHTGYFEDAFTFEEDIPSDVRITLLAMAFGLIKIMSGLLTVISRFADCCCSKFATKQEQFYMDITSKHMNGNHIHSHFLLSIAISKVIRSERSSVEVLRIVEKTNGIHCTIRVDIFNDHDMENYELLFGKTDTKKALNNEIQFILKLDDIEEIFVEKKNETSQAKQSGTDTKIEMEATVENSQKKKKQKKKSPAKETKPKDGDKKKKKAKPKRADLQKSSVQNKKKRSKIETPKEKKETKIIKNI